MQQLIAAIIGNPASIMFFLIFGASVLFVISTILRERKRAEHLRGIARQLGWQFYNDEKGITVQRGFTLIRGGSFGNILAGQKKSGEWKVFEHHDTSGAGRNRRRVIQTCAVVKPDKQIPDFTLKKEHIFHKLGAIVGYNDIDFPQHPKFSKKYFLKSPDTNIRSVFNMETIHHFEQNDISENIESKNGLILIFNPGKRLKPSDIVPFIEKAEQLVNRLSR